MKQSRWARVHCRCPFWRGDGDKVIGCEGPFDDAGIKLTFTSREQQRRHMEIFCADAYENCEIYRMVEENKYDGL